MQIHSDQGRNFESDLFTEIDQLLGMKKQELHIIHNQMACGGIEPNPCRPTKNRLWKCTGSNTPTWLNTYKGQQYLHNMGPKPVEKLYPAKGNRAQ